MEHQGSGNGERRLIAVNIALLSVLGGLVLLSASARTRGQPSDSLAQPRPRGEYAVISGRSQGATTATLYVLDAANQQLAALQWNRTSNRLEPIGFRNLTDDARQQSPSR